MELRNLDFTQKISHINIFFNVFTFVCFKKHSKELNSFFFNAILFKTIFSFKLNFVLKLHQKIVLSHLEKTQKTRKKS